MKREWGSLQTLHSPIEFAMFPQADVPVALDAQPVVMLRSSSSDMWVGVQG